MLCVTIWELSQYECVQRVQIELINVLLYSMMAK